MPAEVQLSNHPGSHVRSRELCTASFFWARSSLRKGDRLSRGEPSSDTQHHQWCTKSDGLWRRVPLPASSSTPPFPLYLSTVFARVSAVGTASKQWPRCPRSHLGRERRPVLVCPRHLVKQKDASQEMLSERGRATFDSFDWPALPLTSGQT